MDALYFQMFRDRERPREESSGLGSRAVHRQHRHERETRAPGAPLRPRSRGHSRGRSRSFEPRAGRSTSRGSRRRSRSGSRRRSASPEEDFWEDFDQRWQSQVGFEDMFKRTPPKPTLSAYIHIPEPRQEDSASRSTSPGGFWRAPLSGSSSNSFSAAPRAKEQPGPGSAGLAGRGPRFREGQGQKKLLKKTAKKAGGADDEAELRRREEEKKEELRRRFEAQDFIETPDTRFSLPVEEPLAAASVEPAPDDSTSVMSGTFTEGRHPRFEEPKLEPLQEEACDAPRSDVLQDIFGDQPWRVLLSDAAFGETKQLTRSQQKAALEVFKTLASGVWAPHFREMVCSHQQQKLKCARGADLDILWSLDMEFSREQKVFVEVVQVWHVTRKEESQRAAEALKEEWQRGSRSFKGLFNALKNQSITYSGDCRNPRTVAAADLQDSDVFSVRKFFSLDSQMLKSILVEEESDRGELGAAEQFALRVSKQEAAIIDKPGPIIVIGRSGSGKTLCCVYRLFFQHMEYWKRASKAGGSALLPSGNGNELVHLHQVFVTHSASLANKVLEYFSNLQATHQNGQGAAPSARLTEQSRLPDNLKNHKNFPLFVTFRKFIVMLDGSLGSPFFPRRFASGAVHPDKVIMAEAPDALDPISALREQRRTALRKAQAKVGQSDSMTEVDYELFKAKFWPKLRQHVPAGCDASLLWREIQSFIKGSYRVLDFEGGHLDLQTYREVAKKASPGFEEHRQQIFTAFKAYQELCKEWRCFDRMDVAWHVIKQLKQQPYDGPPIHSVAVDEVQDLAQLELAVFFMIMKRPYEDLFITGDTSQTVSRAVDFRFCDLRSLFTHFKVNPPEMDQLIINYRSHQKILALSHKGVVRPLELAFPHAIDHLEPDLGHRDGVKPIIVTDVPLEDLAQNVFNLDGSTAGIAFGASQCVLVRSEDSRAKLPEGLKNSLVLTVEQSKGLEFDDCILVNFFKDSLYKEWQTMKIFAQELMEEPLKEAKAAKGKRPHFERMRHTLLCSELKHLYTAMTRTKHVLLIIEEDMEQAKHVELWKVMGLVNFGLMEEENAEARRQIHEHAGKNRGRESWRQMGHNLMRRQLYQQALGAFLRAEDEDMAKVCGAFMRAQQAARAMEESEAEGARLFQEAAGLFEEANARREQAECLLYGGRPQQAADLFETLAEEKPELKVEAARACSAAKRHLRAGQLFEEAGLLRDAIESFLRADSPEANETVKSLVLDAHGSQQLSTEECFRVLQDMDDQAGAGQLYFNEGNFEQAASCFQSAGLLQEEAGCYLELRQPMRAAERLSTSDVQEDLLEAARLYQSHQEYAKEVRCLRALLDQAIDDAALRNHLLVRCIGLHKELREPAEAARLLEQREDYAQATQFFQEAGLFSDAGRVCEKMAEQPVYSFLDDGRQRSAWRKARGFYARAGALKDELRVTELLGDWQECGRLARKLKDFSAAAGFFLQDGDVESAVPCLVDNKDFEQAYQLLQQLPVQDVDLEVRCLVGLERFDEAARKRMQQLPSNSDERCKMVLEAFGLARKSRESYRQFLAEFRHKMPDPSTALIYFAEVADAEQICEQLLQCEQPLPAAAAASILGEPQKALELLERCGLKQERLPKLTLEILLVALQRPASAADAKSLWELHGRIAELRPLLKDIADTARLDYAEATFQRRCGKSGPDRLKKTWEKAKHQDLPHPLQLLIGEEMALAKSGTAADAMWTLTQIDWYIEVAKAERRKKRELDDLLEHGYQVTVNSLHRMFYDALHELREQKEGTSGRPRLERVLPKFHRLCTKEDREVPGFSGAVTVDAKSIVRDLEERRLALLQRLQQICSTRKEDLCNTPGLWLEAFQKANDEPRKLKFKDGFLSSLQQCALVASWNSLTDPVRQQIPQAARDLWQRAWQAEVETLRKPTTSTSQAQMNSAAQKLQKVIKELVHLFWLKESRNEGAWDEGRLAKSVSDLVLEELEELRLICPKHVESKNCQAKNQNCPLDHPRVQKTYNIRQLLATETGGRQQTFDGLGLQGWIDVVDLCSKSVNQNNCTRAGCGYWHPETGLLQNIQRALRESQRTHYLHFDYSKLEDLAPVAKVLRESSQCKALPQGLGFVFREDLHKAENVRLTAILAHALVAESCCKLSPDACKTVLLRMCRAIYRYPDALAADLVKRTLQEVVARAGDEKLREISRDITWEVEGMQKKDNDRCLLSLLLRRQKQQRKQTAPIGSSGLNPHAKEFVPLLPGFLRPNAWEQGDTIARLMGEATAGSRPIGAGQMQGWRPTLARA
ncbi:unnamed protein product [Effrenium voratum]|nr:unnamed protein product [Effrenium voratum]